MGAAILDTFGIRDPAATWCPLELLGTWIKTSLLTSDNHLTHYGYTLLSTLVRSATYLPAEVSLPLICQLVTIDLFLQTSRT